MRTFDYHLQTDIGRAPADVYTVLADVQQHAVRPGSPVLVMEKTRSPRRVALPRGGPPDPDQT